MYSNYKTKHNGRSLVVLYCNVNYNMATHAHTCHPNWNTQKCANGMQALLIVNLTLKSIVARKFSHTHIILLYDTTYTHIHT